MLEIIEKLNRIIPIFLALTLPFTLLPLRPPYGFERSIVLLSAFLLLLLLSAFDNSNNRSYWLYLPALTLPLAAFLSAQGNARYANLASLNLWAAVAGILAPYWTNRSHNIHKAYLLGAALAALALLSRIAPFSSPTQGLDYPTSLTITQKALSLTPIWGVGPDRFGEAHLRYKPITFNNRPDFNLRYELSRSGFMQFLTEYGLIGLLGLAILIGPTISRLRTYHRESSSKEFILTVAPYFIVLIAFLFLPYSPGIWWNLAFLKRSYNNH